MVHARHAGATPGKTHRFPQVTEAADFDIRYYKTYKVRRLAPAPAAGKQQGQASGKRAVPSPRRAPPPQPAAATHPRMRTHRHTSQIVHVRRFSKSYVLYQCGTPDPTALPPGAADGVKPGMASFEVPLYSVAVSDTTANGFLVRGLPCVCVCVCVGPWVRPARCVCVRRRVRLL